MSSEKTFVPMYDLEHLDKDQKAKYYSDACDYLGIPANLNLLAFIFMNQGDAGRHEVLYAKKGATDIIRQNRGITTVSLEVTQIGIPGQICFTVRGRDKNGREEYAIGAASIDGLRGKALSDAIMTAQTRAARRMTLQFVGGGVLDETEIQDQTTTLINNVALDAIQIQPVVLPNVEPGLVVETTPTETQKAAREALGTVKLDTLAKAAGERLSDYPNLPTEYVAYPTMAELAATLPSDNPLVIAATAEVKPPTQRKRKPAGITLNTPEQEAEQVAVNKKLDDIQATIAGKPLAGSSAVEHSADNRATAGSIPAPPTISVSPSADIPQSQPAPTQVDSAKPVEPPKVEKLLNEEQEKEVRARLAKYRNEILPGKPPAGGNMVPIEGIGGVEIQLRTFVSKFNPAKPSSKQWDFIDWKRFLDFFDDVVKNEGATALVHHIQKAIGAIK
jgi:hypothetical protein